MIKSFQCKETLKVFQREFSRKLPHSIQKVAMRKLWMINAATLLDDLRVPPSNRLEALSGKRKRQYGVRINDQWRVCFKWYQGDAYDVEIIDYHK